MDGSNMCMKFLRFLLLFSLPAIDMVSQAHAVTVFSDTLGNGSTINNATPTPANPSLNAAAYQQVSAKTYAPNPPTLANFLQVFEENSIGRYLWNSILVSGGATMVALAIGVPAGF